MNRSVSLAVDVNNKPESARSFALRLRNEGFERLRRAPLSTVQVNLGRLCNQACEHCHVDAGPKRTEIMSIDTMHEIVEWCRANRIHDIDITGGAPEMNPGFREFVDRCLAIGAQVTVRCNLTILMEKGQEDLAHWYAARGIKLVCSLPCYSSDNVDRQRGKGVYQRSIDALRQLNAVGYGHADALTLDLVYNPGGAFLPPSQSLLERGLQARTARASRHRVQSLAGAGQSAHQPFRKIPA
jgi:radical SAM/Cys-rich protein